MIDGPSYLPPALMKGGPHFHWQCHPAETSTQDTAIHSALSPSFDPLSSSLKPVNFPLKPVISQMHRSMMTLTSKMILGGLRKWLWWLQIMMAPSILSRVSHSLWHRIFMLTNTLAPRKSTTDEFQGTIISLTAGI